MVPDNALSYWGSKGPNPQQLSLNNQIVHTVGKNESLWTIARYFDVDLKNIAEINGLENPDLIFLFFLIPKRIFPGIHFPKYFNPFMESQKKHRFKM